MIIVNESVRDYLAPDMAICEVAVENGFLVSQNPDWTYGDEGAAGDIGDGGSYDL